MHTVMNILSGLTNLYMILIFIRVMLTWFSGVPYSRPVELLGQVTDPYLNWFSRFPLRIANLDLSPVLALIVLSTVNNIFSTLSRYGSITLGVIAAMILSALWSAASFLLSLCLIIVVLRFIAYITNRNIYGSFWHIIDTISKPIVYRINRIIFRNRLVSYSASIITAGAVLLALRVGLGALIQRGITFLARLPI